MVAQVQHDARSVGGTEGARILRGARVVHEAGPAGGAVAAILVTAGHVGHALCVTSGADLLEALPRRQVPVVAGMDVDRAGLPDPPQGQGEATADMELDGEEPFSFAVSGQLRRQGTGASAPGGSRRPRFPVPRGCVAPFCQRCITPMELRGTRQGGLEVIWSCRTRGCVQTRRPTRAVVEAHGREEPEQLCSICLQTCQEGDSFEWPCHHAVHHECVAMYYARQPRPPCPMCREAWSEETEASFRRDCEPAGEPADDRPAVNIPPPRPQHSSAFCWCEARGVAMQWAPIPSHQDARAVAQGGQGPITWTPAWHCGQWRRQLLGTGGERTCAIVS